MRRGVQCLLLAGLTAACATAARAGEVFTLTSVADAMVVAQQPASNFGGAGALSVASAGMPQGEFQTVMRFDTSAARAAFDAIFGAGQWTVASVALQLNAAPPNNDIFNDQDAGQFAVEWMQADGWTEGTGGPSAPGATGINFNTLPGFLASGTQMLGTTQYNGTFGPATYQLGTSAGLSADVAGGGLVSLWLHAAESSMNIVFNSRNFGNSNNRPRMTLTAVPEPGTAAMVLLSGLLILAPRRRG